MSLLDGDGVYEIFMPEYGAGGMGICVGRIMVVVVVVEEELLFDEGSSDKLADEPVLDTRLPMRNQDKQEMD